MKNLPALVAIAATSTVPVMAAEPPAVPYPEGYRNWTHVKSMVIQPGHPLADAFSGIHHVYANPKAMQGYRRGDGFANGAVIVFDLLEATTANSAIEEGGRKVVGVMAKDSRKWAATGGWGFEAFKADSKTDRAIAGKAAAACFGCHEPQKSRDYVFSRYRP